MNTQDKLHQIYSQRNITDKEFHLIEELRKLRYGEVKVFVRDSQPVRMVEPKESIEL